MDTVTTGRVRASFVHIFEPRVNELSGKEEYSMQLLIPKTDKATIKALEKLVDASIEAKWPKGAPAGLRRPLRDGDAPAEAEGTEKYPERAGHYFCNIKSKFRPGIVDANLQEVIDPRSFGSGDYCKVALNAYSYDQKGNRGVSLGLLNVQVLDKGEPLAGGPRPQDHFKVEEVEEDDLLAG